MNYSWLTVRLRYPCYGNVLRSILLEEATYMSDGSSMVPDKSGSITAASWSLGGLSIILVALRLYIRVWVTRLPGWDDFFAAFALVRPSVYAFQAHNQATGVVCSALAQVAVHYGLGMHTADITDPYDKVNALKYTVIAPNFSVVSTTAGKISVSIFLLRLLGYSAKLWQRWFLYILNAVSVIWNAFAILVIMGFCRPPQKIWLPETPGSCFPMKVQLVGGISQAGMLRSMET